MLTPSNKFWPSFGIWILFFICVGLSVAAITISRTDGNNPCQGHDKTGLSLGDWLLVVGIESLCSTALICYIMWRYYVLEEEGWKIIQLILQFFQSLFTLAWFVVGIVIVARSHGQCVNDATSLGIMTMIILVLQGLSICGHSSSLQ